MNVQLFGNIDNKTYQAPRINLMQKVQEKGATPLTFKETIKGLNDANVSVSISDEGLKALHGSKLQGAIDPMETAKQIEYMSNHQPVESFSNRFAQMLPSNYEMNDQGEAVFVSHTLQEKEDALISGFKQLYNEISIGHSLGTRIRYIEDETAEDGFRKLTKDEELEILKQEFDDFVDSRFGAEAQAQNAKAAKAMKEIEQLKESLGKGSTSHFESELIPDGFADNLKRETGTYAKRYLIDKTLVEIEKGNTVTRTTADAFNQIIADMESFAEIAQNTMEKANSQAESLEQIGQGIEQLSGVVQGNAASSEENTAISINLAEGAAKMQDRVNIFKLF